MFGKEPTVVLGSLSEVIRAVIPMLLVFGYVHWTDAQTGSVMLVVGVTIGALNVIFTRSQTVSTQVANDQIKTAIKAPSDTTVAEVVAITKENT